LATIRVLLATARPRSQEELSRLLAGEGVGATQATLSRDLRELGVLKGPDGYVLPGSGNGGSGAGGETPRALVRSLKGAMIDAKSACNLVVVRTQAGHAPALALEVDRAGLPGVVGTVAGDDTIFIATAHSRAASRMARVLTDMLRGA
jgi:transcriptional regulator of arginine metabolism